MSLYVHIYVCNADESIKSPEWVAETEDLSDAEIVRIVRQAEQAVRAEINNPT